MIHCNRAISATRAIGTSYQASLMWYKMAIRKGIEPESKAHRIALKTFRRRKFASLLMTKEMIENVLFEFKGK